MVIYPIGKLVIMLSPRQFVLKGMVELEQSMKFEKMLVASSLFALLLWIGRSIITIVVEGSHAHQVFEWEAFLMDGI